MTVNKLISKSTTTETKTNTEDDLGKTIEQLKIANSNGVDDLEDDTSYRVYTRRWFILLIPLGHDVLFAFRSWRFPIVNIVFPFWDSTVTQAVAWSILPLVLNAMLLLPSGRALDRWGIRKMAYITGPILIASNVIQSIILMDESNSYIWIPREYRFGTFVFCNVLMMISLANFIGFTAKIANDWFPMKETTLVLVLPTMASKLFEAAVGYVTPIIVKTSDDLRYIGYINLTLITLYALIIITCVTRSQPRIPPSKNARLARVQIEQPFSAFIQIIKIPAFMFAMFSFGINAMAQIIMKAVFSETLALHGYSNEFSGILMSIGSITTLFGCLAGAWLDRNYDYIYVSKITSILMAITFCVHYMSQLVEDIKYVILISGIALAFFHSILIPLQMQAILRPSKGILLDASLSCLNALVSAISNTVLTIILTLSKNYAPPGDNNLRAYIAFCTIIVVANLAYTIGYKLPNQMRQNENVDLESKDKDVVLAIEKKCPENVANNKLFVKR